MRVVPWKRHLRLEKAAIVHRVRVEYDYRYTPLEDVLVDQLDRRSVGCSSGSPAVCKDRPVKEGVERIPQYVSTSPCSVP